MKIKIINDKALEKIKSNVKENDEALACDVCSQSDTCYVDSGSCQWEISWEEAPC